MKKSYPFLPNTVVRRAGCEHEFQQMLNILREWNQPMSLMPYEVELMKGIVFKHGKWVAFIPDRHHSKYALHPNEVLKRALVYHQAVFNSLGVWKPSHGHGIINIDRKTCQDLMRGIAALNPEVRFSIDDDLPEDKLCSLYWDARTETWRMSGSRPAYIISQDLFLDLILEGSTDRLPTAPRPFKEPQDVALLNSDTIHPPAFKPDDTTCVQAIIDLAVELRSSDVKPSVPPGYVFGKHDAMSKIIKAAIQIRDEYAMEELKAAYLAGQKNIHRSAHDWFNETFPNYDKQNG